MSIATSTAIAIGGVAAAGATIAGAKMASGATKDAAQSAADASKTSAQIQADTAKQALAIQQQQYQQRLQNLAPYRAIGGGALTNLQTLMGITPTPQSPPPSFDGNGAPVTMAKPPGSTMPLPGGMPPGLLTQNGSTDTQTYAPGFQAPSGPQGPVTIRPSAGSSAPPAGSPNVSASSGSGFVTMQSPDGRKVQVPQAMVPQALAQGGQVING